MKKCLSIIICFALSLSFFFHLPITSVAAESKEQYLIGKGLSEEIVYDCSDVVLDKLYETLYGENKILLSVDSSEMSETSLTRGTIDPSMMKLLVVAAADVTTVNNQDRIDDVVVVVCSTWYECPKIRWTDKIAVNWDASVFTYKANSFSLSCYDHNEDYSRTVYHSSTTLKTLTQGGMGYDVPLTPSNNDALEIESVASFVLLPANGPIYQSTGYSTTAINAEYAHDKNLFTGDFSFTISGVFVSMSPSGFWDSTSTAANIYYKN